LVGKGVRSLSIVIRLWCAEEDGEWRGELQEVTTGRSHRFTGWEELAAVLRRILRAESG